MKQTKEILLKNCLENRNPILYVGAGFSYNCKNSTGQKVELASGLCNLLFEQFWNGGRYSNDSIKSYKSIAEKYKCDSDLKSLCQLLRQIDCIKERDQFLTEYFAGCSIDSIDKRNYICGYPWEKIFTVNIDDLIEYIYSNANKPINVWNRNNDDKKHSTKFPTLIKLHGCVNNPSLGYVFDKDEYTTFFANSDYMLNEFGDAFSKNDIIFVGTEFQEDDLEAIIAKYEQMGYDSSSVNQYFFIVPKINNKLLELRIQKSKHMFHIPMTSEEFFEFIKTKIILKDEKYNKLKEYGLVNIYELYDKTPPNYTSELYHGYDITYSDLKYNWDIIQTDFKPVDWATTDNHNKIISLYGKEYTGKTCKAKRILYDFFIIGYTCFEFKIDSSYKMELFMDYINNHIETKIAILFEGAAYQYEFLVKEFIDKNPNKQQIIIITTDILENHNRKKYSLSNNINCKTIYVDETINDDRAELIFDKLNEKHSLSRLLDISNEKNKIILYMKENNDIIDILYFSSLGRGFSEHIRTYILSDIVKTDASMKLIAVFCVFDEMGITYISERLFIECAKIIKSNFSKSVFDKNYDKLLQIENKYYHLRYMRFLKSLYKNVLNNTEIKDILICLIKSVSGRFNEGEYNELSSILYKTLNIKSLNKFFSFLEIKELYYEIEKTCNQYSYYWVERGLCAQKQVEPDYEEADRFLREARRINKKSYQVSHAIAKNLIERGLFSLKDDISSEEYFNDGISKMQELIEDKRYSRAFTYSLHAYIDSLIRYSDVSGKIISDEECEFINICVRKLKEEDLDEHLVNILIVLKNYAKRKKISNKLDNVVKKFWKKSKFSNNYLEVYIENDWII